jgi:hypothetical protein
VRGTPKWAKNPLIINSDIDKRKAESRISTFIIIKIHLLQANSVASLIASEKSFQQLLTASAKMRCLFEGVRITIVKAVERCRVRQRIAST